MKESFVFYRSFFEAIQPLEPVLRAKVMEAICEYGLNKKEIELDPMAQALFSLIKPQLDANYARYVNGKKGGRFGVLGGRPKKPLENPTETPNANVNDNVNVNVNGNVKKKYNKKEFEKYKDVKMTVEEYDKLVQDFGEKETMVMIERLFLYIKSKGDKYKNHYFTILNWKRKDGQSVGGSVVVQYPDGPHTKTEKEYDILKAKGLVRNSNGKIIYTG